MKEKTMEVNAVTEELDTVSQFVERELEKYGCPVKFQTQIAVAVEEIFVNIVHYAYDEGTVGKVKLTINIYEKKKEVVLRFQDKGIPFNPLAKANPDITAGIEEREIGGLGIFMVKKICDDVSYKREDGQNMFTVMKRWE